MSARDRDGADPGAGFDRGHGPTAVSRYVAVAAAALAAVATAPFSLPSLPVGGLGLGAVAYGLFVAESRAWALRGVAGVFAGGLVAVGFGGVAPALALLSMAALMVAWFAAQNAFDLGAQLGTHARTARAEMVQAGVVAAAAVLVAAGAYLTYSLGSGGQPASALTLLLVGALVAAWGVRR